MDALFWLAAGALALSVVAFVVMTDTPIRRAAGSWGGFSTPGSGLRGMA